MLLVIIDESNIGRRRDQHIDRWQLDRLRIAINDMRIGSAPQRREFGDAFERVERVAPQEADCIGCRRADAIVLVTVVRFGLRLARKIEIEMRRQPRGPGGARQDDLQDVLVFILLDRVAKQQQGAQRVGMIPGAQVHALSRDRLVLAE